MAANIATWMTRAVFVIMHSSSALLNARQLLHQQPNRQRLQLQNQHLSQPLRSQLRAVHHLASMLLASLASSPANAITTSSNAAASEDQPRSVLATMAVFSAWLLTDASIHAQHHNQLMVAGALQSQHHRRPRSAGTLQSQLIRAVARKRQKLQSQPKDRSHPRSRRKRRSDRLHLRRRRR